MVRIRTFYDPSLSADEMSLEALRSRNRRHLSQEESVIMDLYDINTTEYDDDGRVERAITHLSRLAEQGDRSAVYAMYRLHHEENFDDDPFSDLDLRSSYLDLVDMDYRPAVLAEAYDLRTRKQPDSALNVLTDSRSTKGDPFALGIAALCLSDLGERERARSTASRAMEGLKEYEWEGAEVYDLIWDIDEAISLNGTATAKSTLTGKPVDVKDGAPSGLRLSDVKGNSEAKRVIEERLILPYREPEVYETLGIKPSGGVLLYGPPGNGKTMLARAVATETGAYFKAVGIHDIRNRFVGDTEKAIHELFEDLRSHLVSVLFIDELDAVAHRRTEDMEAHEVSFVNALLTELDGFVRNESSHTLIVIGATNNLGDVDPAFLREGRFGTRVLVGPPDAEAREGIVRSQLEGVPVKDLDYEGIVRRTKGFSGADVAGIVNGARFAAARRIRGCEGARIEITQADFETSFEENRRMTSGKPSDGETEGETSRDVMFG